MRKLLLIALLLLAPAIAYAQTTTVTGTVTDPNGNAYANGTVSAFLILPAGAPIPPGARQSSGPFSLSASGFFSITLASPLTYTFSFCGTPVNLGPRGNPTPNSVCFGVPSPIAVSGVSQDITSQISAVPPALLGPNTTSSSTLTFVGAPTGPCSASQTAVDTTTGNFYSCLGGVWHLVTGAFSSPVTSPNPFSFDVGVAFGGPNPYIDATTCGIWVGCMRAVPATVAPAVPGITGSCSNGSPILNINIPSTFRNGDGIVAYGCGAGTIAAPVAPTVVPSVLAGQTGLLLDVPGPVGAVQYCYQVVTRSLLGAINISPETCTATGPASLGLQTNSIVSCTLVLSVMNCLTSAPHGLVVGAHIVSVNTTVNTVGGQANGTSSSNPFAGWFKVATVPDNTHFTVNLLSDTRNGAIASSTGGTLNYWNSIHITEPELTNNYIYYVYGRVTGGTKTLIGAMWPQDVNLQGRLTDPTYLAFDDLGSTVTTFPNPPPYIPTTVPTVPTNEMLVSTIASGAGTTALVLANNAGNTNSGQTVLLDDAVTFLAAANYAGTSGTIGQIVIPDIGSTASSINYVFNSPISLGTGATSRLSVYQKGSVRLNEPIFTTVMGWYGQPSTSSTVASFSNFEAPTIQFNTCSPCLVAQSSTYFDTLNWAMLSGNGALGFMQDAGGIPSSGAFRKVNVNTGTVTTYSNIGMLFRGSGAGFEFTDNAIVGSQNNNLTATTPGIYFDASGNVSFRNLSLSGIGTATRVNPAGNFVSVDNVYCQGCYQPYFSAAAAPADSLATFILSLKNVTFDTHSLPLVANYGGHSVTVDVIGTNTLSSNDPFITGSQVPSGGFPRSSFRLSGTSGIGTPANIGASIVNSNYNTNDGTFGRVAMPIDLLNRSQSIGLGFSLFTTTGLQAPPTSCPVSAGGSVPVGTFFYFYAPIYANGSEGALSTYCTATTTGGNQTVTVNWAAIPGVTQYNVYRGQLLSNIGGASCAPVTGLTYVDTAAGVCGWSAPLVPAGGPCGMRGGLMWCQTLQLGVLGFASLGTPPNGTFTFCPDCTIANPCAGAGTGALAKRLNGVWVCN